MAARLRCLGCKEVLESKHRHDFVTCSCGNLSVDGGDAYLRVVGGEKGYEVVTDSEDLLGRLKEKESR